MTPERWQQIEKLCYEALELNSEQRTVFLNQICASDEELGQEVKSMLAANDRAGNFLQQNAFELEAEALAQEKTHPLPMQNFNHYKIISRIGAGGMGEVWLADDTRLHRQVAIKLLPAVFTTDSDRLRRFEQEARAASALNHPNIVTVHEIGQSEEMHYLVTEFVNGQTLRQRLTEGALSVAQTLEIAEQIAEALAAAHGAGIIHRDIKPENVMLRRDGYVKVLDFGLAKLTALIGIDSGSLSQMDTLRAANTNPGVILGTPRYMSPEQARGVKVDSRSDIFSLGVLLYELLTGKPPFTGETLSDIIAAVLMAAPPPLAETASETPPDLQRIVGKSLEKDPAHRYQTADDLLSDLRNCKTELEISERVEHRLQHNSSQQTLALAPPARIARPWGSPKVWVPAALLIGLIGVSVWRFAGGKASIPGTPSVWPVKALNNWRSSINEGSTDYRFSPNGEFIAFSAVRNGHRQIFLNQTGEDHMVAVTNNEWNSSNPIWSPDGRDLAFVSDQGGKRSVWRIRALGGAQSMVATPEQSNIRLRHWSADGATIYFESSSTRQLFALDAATGKTYAVTPAESSDKEMQDFDFRVAPDGKKTVFVRNQQRQTDLWVRGLDGNNLTRITNDAANDSSPVWLPDGQRIIYSSRRNGVLQICAVRFDGSQPEQLTFGESDYEVADVVSTADGVRILCSAIRSEADLWRVKVASGQEEQLTSDLSFDLWPSLAPDGKTLAYQSIILREPTQRANLAKSTLMLQTSSVENKARQLIAPAFEFAWSPDGKQIAFLRTEGDGTTNLWVTSLAEGKERQLTMSGLRYSTYGGLPNQRSQPNDFSWDKDNKRIAYIAIGKTSKQLSLVAVDGSNETTAFYVSSTPGEELFCPTWSRDGQRLAFVSQAPSKTEAGKTDWGIWITDLSTGQTRMVFQPEYGVRLLGWGESDQDLWLAFDNNRRGLSLNPQPVRVLQLLLKQQQAIARFTLPSAYLFNVFLSPNGRFIAFTSQQNERDSLEIIPITGGAPRKLVEGKETRVYFSSLAWSHDNREIYYGKQVNWRLLSMIDRFK